MIAAALSTSARQQRSFRLSDCRYLPTNHRHVQRRNRSDAKGMLVPTGTTDSSQSTTNCSNDDDACSLKLLRLEGLLNHGNARKAASASSLYLECLFYEAFDVQMSKYEKTGPDAAWILILRRLIGGLQNGTLSRCLYFGTCARLETKGKFRL